MDLATANTIYTGMSPIPVAYLTDTLDLKVFYELIGTGKAKTSYVKRYHTNPMARMRPPIVPDQPVPVVPEDGPRRLLAVCAGKTSRPAGTPPSSCSYWTPAPTGVSWPTSSSPTWTWTWTWTWRSCSARDVGSVPFPMAARPLGRHHAVRDARSR
jgi:hypothetical protein